MKRGPKPGKAASKRTLPVLRDDLGECPPELRGVGREFWGDAVAHLQRTGRASRVYRHPLALVCRLLEGLPTDGEIGINKSDGIRRWLHELGLTPSTHTSHRTDDGDDAKTGKAKLLHLITRRSAGA